MLSAFLTKSEKKTMNKQSLNRVFLIGRLGDNPLGKTTPTGKSVTTFSLATNESWLSDDGKTIEHVEWHHLCVFGSLADFSLQALKKGQLILAEGKIRSRFWVEGKTKKKKIEILCSNITVLEKKQ